MTLEEYTALNEIVNRKPFEVRPALLKWFLTLEVPTPEEKKATRTSSQNKALHVGFGLIAKSLNDAGLDIRATLKPEVEMPWDADSVKEYIFRPVMKLMKQKESTKELDKQSEITEIWETIMRFLMQNHHIEYIPFPNNETKAWEQLAPMTRSAVVGYDDNYVEPLV